MANDYSSGYYGGQRSPMDASTENQRQQGFLNEQDRKILEMHYEAQRRAAGLGNDAANSNTDRALVVRNQELAADNVRNQLSNLTQARSNSANAINNAMTGVMNMYK